MIGIDLTMIQAELMEINQLNSSILGLLNLVRAKTVAVEAMVGAISGTRNERGGYYEEATEEDQED